MNAEDLRKALEDFGTVEVEEERGRFVAHVVSPRFEGMEEGARQHQAWARVRERFGLRAGVDIEFIFTYSPNEWDQLMRGEELVGA